MASAHLRADIACRRRPYGVLCITLVIPADAGTQRGGARAVHAELTTVRSLRIGMHSTLMASKRLVGPDLTAAQTSASTYRLGED